MGAAAIDPDDPILSADDLVDQIAEVLNYFGWACSTLLVNFFPFRLWYKVLEILEQNKRKGKVWNEISNGKRFHSLCLES